jgi:hypothetical protein
MARSPADLIQVHGYMLTVLGRQFHASQQLIRLRASRNENDGIDEKVSLETERTIRWHDLAD